MEVILVRPLSSKTSLPRLIELCESAAQNSQFRFIILSSDDRIDFEPLNLTLETAKLMKPLIDSMIEESK